MKNDVTWKYNEINKNSLAVLIILLFIFQLAGCTPQEDNRRYTVGLVTNNPNGLKNIEGFKEGMSSFGWSEGDSITYISPGKPVKGEALRRALDDMVEAEVDLIFTAGTPTGVAAHKATMGTDIPVVFGVIADPVMAGVMDNLTRPGGNMTGVKLSQNQARRMELFLELVPGIRRVFIPFNPQDSAPASAITQINELAPKLGVEVVEGHALSSDIVPDLIAGIPEDIDAVFMLPDSTVNAHIDELVTTAIQRRLPISGPSMIQVEKGTLTAYGIIHHNAGKQAARIANQILKGAEPGNIPVETAEMYLGLNLVTAEAIGVEIPYGLLKRAEVILRGDQQQTQ